MRILDAVARMTRFLFSSQPLRATLAAVLILMISCGRGEIRANHWNEMSHEQKTLIVKSLMGAQTEAARKGGTPATYSGAVGEYVDRIDGAYERGDDRPVKLIWRDLAD